MSSIRSRAPSASSAAVRDRMQRVPRAKTEPELNLARALRAEGARLRTNVRPIPHMKITADIVLPAHRICVFVDGCFWHGCARHFRPPVANRDWWREKIEDNRRRDDRQRRRLSRLGWRVLRVWEHDVASARITNTVARILRKAESAPPREGLTMPSSSAIRR